MSIGGYVMTSPTGHISLTVRDKKVLIKYKNVQLPLRNPT